MKKVLFSLLTLIAMVAMTACGSNDTEKKLNGKWQTTLTESGQQLTMTGPYKHFVEIGQRNSSANNGFYQ